MAVGDDFDLLSRWRSGEREAGNALVRRHFEAVYRFFRSKIDECPKDLIQATFMTCVEISDRVPRDVGFRPYLLGIARNKLLHHFRGRQREQNALARAPTRRADSCGTPSQLVAAAQERRLLLRAMRTLSLDLQITVELFYWEDLSVAEIATVLAMPSGTVKSRLWRARELLRATLAELAECHPSGS